LKRPHWHRRNPRFSYAAKLICGVQGSSDVLRLTRGAYGTTVNILNQGRSEAEIEKRLVLSFPPAEQMPGNTYRIGLDHIPPGHAIKVDCDYIRQRLFPNGFPESYVEGFITLESNERLEVVGVYTASSMNQAGQITGGSSIDIERVAGTDLVTDKPKPRPTPKPNLRPTPALPLPEEANLPEGFPGVLFCVPNPQGGTPAKIRALIRNLGPVAADASTARAEFGNAGSVNVPVAAIPPNGAQEVEFDIPRGCYGPDSLCAFEVTADAPGQIDESVEGDNTTAGFCVEAAG